MTEQGHQEALNKGADHTAVQLDADSSRASSTSSTERSSQGAGNEMPEEGIQAAQSARLPADFTHPTAPGRSRLLTDEHFVPCSWVDDDQDKNQLLLPQYQAQAYEQDRDDRFEEERLAKEEARRRAAEQRYAESEVKDEERRKRKEAEAAAAAAQAQQAKRDALIKKVGLTGDPERFCASMQNVSPNLRLQVFRPEDIERMAGVTQSVDSDLHKRNESIGQALELKGPLRLVGLPRSFKAMLDLKEALPHFGEVIDFVVNHVELQKRSRELNPGRPAARLPPMLLNGPPGVGKTHFCEALADVLGVPVRRNPMDQAETSAALLGSDMSWSNSRFGLVFELLALGDYANPVVILDELDKANSTSVSSGVLTSPTAVLHSLLEPISAARVRDISLNLEIDASQVSWIATANYPWLVPATLRSRMKEFFIFMPDAEQAIQVARSVVRSALASVGMTLDHVDRQLIIAVAHLSAREIYQATIEATAAAVRRGGVRVLVADLPRDLLGSLEAYSTTSAWLH
ncbi:AAA family ATPase [Hydrogenophaga sp. R2]|uniref:AAA family ATPase n=1 Tax=Hydrogenophaga sp. R2 TaxID=3132827 RepID=UPI003CEEBAB2